MNKMNSTLISGGASRQMDRELQEQLYNNIVLLNMTHKPSPEFKAVLKKDMFAKSNKTAFLHVVHYLLTVLNPEIAQEKLVTWPTAGSIKRENKFRTEVLQYLNQLNTLYEEADLPLMMSSHLLAPGGHRFINYMYKLSQLVLREDLKKDYSLELLCRPKPSKNKELNEKAHQALITHTQEINSETINIMNEFKKMFETYQKQAETILKQKHDIQQEFKDIEEKIAIEEEKFQTHKLPEQEINRKLQEIKEKSAQIDKINNTYEICKNLVSHLKEFNDGEFLNLTQSLGNLNIKLRRELSELPDYEVSELESLLRELDEKKNELKKVQKILERKNEVFVEAMSQSEDTLINVLDELKGEKL